MRHPITISHKLHPARREQLTGLLGIKYCLAANESLYIGTSNVDALYDRIKELYPEAKLSKGKDCVIIGRDEE